ncbi:hypothetical protein [Corynebacterium auriscanis]|uniref:hypothetical protein n=1 Tax=Corynebacterium auriscanis TaxID=99807 RepID=UPI0022465F16|nr:hypothetical protein [Corynebacterium auriscanis]MCX2162437.1 hypothetical protein [Corynebacterium auriscanis]
MNSPLKRFLPFGRNSDQSSTSTTSQQGSQGNNSNGYPNGLIATRFFAAIDRSAQIQAPAIRSYVQKLTEKNADKSLDEKQAILDKHFMNLLTGTGAGTGGIAAVPGLGTLLSIGAVGGESLLVLEACGLYSLASAHLHGIDIDDEEKRRAIVLLSVSGADDNELVSALSQGSTLASVKSLRGVTKAPRKDLPMINGVLGKLALRQMRKAFAKGMFRKIMPFGIGLVLGVTANRAIAKTMIEQVHRFVAEAGQQTSVE